MKTTVSWRLLLVAALAAPAGNVWACGGSSGVTASSGSAMTASVRSSGSSMSAMSAMRSANMNMSAVSARSANSSARSAQGAMCANRSAQTTGMSSVNMSGMSSMPLGFSRSSAALYARRNNVNSGLGSTTTPDTSSSNYPSASSSGMVGFPQTFASTSSSAASDSSSPSASASTPAVTKTVAHKDYTLEDLADSKLHLGMTLIKNGRTEAGQRWLRQVTQDYAGTNAAAHALAMLDQ